MTATPATDVRVRFAPSPTGSPHIGNLRTAVVNWIFARHHGGSFLVRIEDTDVERSDAIHETAHLEALRWLGLDWDEGPDVGGPVAPYRQSERRAIYDESLQALVAAGKAYPCFCSEKELHAARRRASTLGVSYVYNRKCRVLTTEEVAARRAAGETAVIRFDIHGMETMVHDIVKGEIRFSGELLGDFVIVRADGMPTYNFVAAVDDITMGITHVLRGEDHLSNTPRQMAIQEVLGHRHPNYGHLPLLLGEAGAKMSKREGDFSIDRFLREGILAPAVLNYLATLGWSAGEGDTQEVFTQDELIAKYDLSRVSHSPAHFQEARLQWFNAQHMRRLDPEKLLTAMRSYWIHRYPTRAVPPSLANPKPVAHRILETLQPSFHNMAEAIRDYRSVARRPSHRQLAKVLGLPLSKEEALILMRAQQVVPTVAGQSEDIVATTLKELQKGLQKDEGIKPPDFYHALRGALTGYEQGPELKKVVHLLDAEEVMTRLVSALRVAHVE